TRSGSDRAPIINRHFLCKARTARCAPGSVNRSRKYFPNLLQNLLLNGLVLSIDRRRELRQEFLLFLVHFSRNRDIHRHIEITASRAATLGNAAILDAEDRPGLSAGGDVKTLLVFLKRQYLDFRAQRSLRERNRNVTEKVVFTAFEKLMFLNMENDVQVA